MTNQRKVDQICNNVREIFNPPRIKFLKIHSYPASAGMRIGFDYLDSAKVITFSKEYIDQHSTDKLANFLQKDTLAVLKKEGDQHLHLK